MRLGEFTNNLILERARLCNDANSICMPPHMTISARIADILEALLSETLNQNFGFSLSLSILRTLRRYHVINEPESGGERIYKLSM